MTEVEELRSIIESIEYGATEVKEHVIPYDPSGAGAFPTPGPDLIKCCPMCHCYPWQGHTTKCKIGKVLGK